MLHRSVALSFSLAALPPIKEPHSHPLYDYPWARNLLFFNLHPLRVPRGGE